MIKTIYGRALKVLMRKPLRLWGISLLYVVLSSVMGALFGLCLGLSLSVSVLMSTSMTMVFLHGYRGEEVQVVQLFDSFKDWNTIKRVVCGMGWMYLWTFLWGLVPIAGPVLAIIRTYEYRLVPYILVTEPDVPITEATKVSSKRTYGYKGKMWLADWLIYVPVFAIMLVLGLFGSIPYIGILFILVEVVFVLACAALSTLFNGLVQAAFYEEITNPTIPAEPVPPVRPAQPARPAAPRAPVNAEAPAFCPNCGSRLTPGSAFCPNCGQRV